MEIVDALKGKRQIWLVPSFHELLRAGSTNQDPIGALEQHPAAHRARDAADRRRPAGGGVRAPRAREPGCAAGVRRPSPRPGLGGTPRWSSARGCSAPRPTRRCSTRRCCSRASTSPTGRCRARSCRSSSRRSHGWTPTSAAPTPLRSTTSSRRSSSRRAVRGAASTGARASISTRCASASSGACAASPRRSRAIIERLALMKAGLSDPTRPHAVLLFVGPTGTGKTELAKALAEILFGSPERMIRLDLSEYHGADGVYRLTGRGGPRDRSLVASIRREPHSVVLLDEFEKAGPEIWDLFLQVFDDGRLTDGSGATADFRQAVIIATSNVGSALPTGDALGFSTRRRRASRRARSSARSRARSGPSSSTASTGSSRSARSRARHARAAAGRARRGRPAARAAQPRMGRRVGRVGDRVPARRGLRAGARRAPAAAGGGAATSSRRSRGRSSSAPTRRATSSCSSSAATASGLTGALRRSRGPGRPVAPGRAAGEERAPDTSRRRPRRRCARSRWAATGRHDELRVLVHAHRCLRRHVEAEEWSGLKAAARRRCRTPGFWDSPDRHRALGFVEEVDRIEAGLRTAGSLLARLDRPTSPQAAERDLVRRVAERLLLLGWAVDALRAGEPRDAYLAVEASAPMPRSSRRASSRCTAAGRGGAACAWTCSTSARARAGSASSRPCRGFGALHGAAQRARPAHPSSTAARRGSARPCSERVRVRVSPQPDRRDERRRWHARPADGRAPRSRRRRVAADRAPLPRRAVAARQATTCAGGAAGASPTSCSGDFDLFE